MFGTWSVEVKDVRPFAIHGDQYLELFVVLASDREGTVVSLKAPMHAVKAPQVKAGDRLIVAFLAGQVTSAKPAP